MNEYRYILEPYKGMSTRHRCPSCQQRDKTFSLYIDSETGQHFHPSVGRCNRECKCGYHYTPKQYFDDNNISFDSSKSRSFKPNPISFKANPVSFIPVKIFKASLKGHESNHFVIFLIKRFGVEVASELVSRYFIATSKHWNGATVFWQIDTKGKIRTGKIMLYHADTGKRIKKPYNHITWVHSLMKKPEFELRQCLFGEHLLIDKKKPVAIVESEKTAVIASVYLPQFIWLACGSLSNLTDTKCGILKGRNVVLFPDLNGFDKWNNQAKELSHLARFTVSDLLERKANETEKQQGFDLADYLIQFNYREFVLQENLTKPDIEIFPSIHQFPKFEIPKIGQPESWEQDIIELRNYFAEVTLKTLPIKLNPSSTVTNCSLFLESHFTIVKANSGKQTFLPYLNRLKELKQVLTTKLELK
jgi:hypothetical protein